MDLVLSTIMGMDLQQEELKKLKKELIPILYAKNRLSESLTAVSSFPIAM